MLSFLAQGVKQNLEKDSKIFADLHGWLASESPLATLPADLSSSSDRPDIVVTTATEVSILELTVCANVASNFASAKRRKEDRYAPLIADLEARGLSVIYVTLELGTLGHYTKDALRALQLIMPSTARGVLSNLLKSLAKIAIGCSQTIFNARHSILVYIKTVLCYLTLPCFCFVFVFHLYCSTVVLPMFLYHSYAPCQVPKVHT